MECIQVDEDLSIGSQPTESELEDLTDQGFRSVVNLRTNGEENQPLSPREEGVGVRNLGLEYVSIAVPLDDMQPNHIDNFRAKLKYLPTPVYVHSGRDKRASTLTVIHKALSEGWGGGKALDEAKRLGVPCDIESMRDLVVGYVDEHQKSESV